MGFNVVSMSNNHVLDQGEEGLISSLDYWGTAESARITVLIVRRRTLILSRPWKSTE